MVKDFIHLSLFTIHEVKIDFIHLSLFTIHDVKIDFIHLSLFTIHDVKIDFIHPSLFTIHDVKIDFIHLSLFTIHDVKIDFIHLSPFTIHDVKIDFIHPSPFTIHDVKIDSIHLSLFTIHEELTMNRAHKKLDVWVEGVSLATEMYKVTESFPKSEIYGITSQMRRAVVSIPSNIAEGAARHSGKEFAQFLNIAGGSLSELDTQIEIASNLGYILPETKLVLESKIDSISRKLAGLINKIRQNITNN